MSNKNIIDVFFKRKEIVTGGTRSYALITECAWIDDIG